MDLDPTVRLEWSSSHCLSRRSLRWIKDHAEAGDAHPVATALDELRRPT